MILLFGNFDSHFPPSIFLVGPNKYLTTLSVILIILFNIFFECLLMHKYYYKLPRFLNKCSPFGLYVMPIACTVSILMYLRVYFSNPGYIPKSQSEETSARQFPNKRLHECSINI